MNSRIAALLFAFIIFLPSCGHNPGSLQGPAADTSVNLEYSYGAAIIHMEIARTATGEGEEETPPVVSYDAHYTVRRADGSRLAWDVVLDNLRLFGESKGKAYPFYSVSFTSDAKGRNIADMVEHDVAFEDVLHLGGAVLKGLALPLGKTAVGERAMPVQVAALRSGEMELIFPEPNPAYVYDGMKVVDGHECLSFSYKGDVTVRQGGVDTPGTLSLTAVRNRGMLPVAETGALAAQNGGQYNCLKLLGKYKCDSVLMVKKVSRSTKGTLLDALRDAPLQTVTEPVGFHYAPAFTKFSASVGVRIAEEGNRAAGVPVMLHLLWVKTAGGADDLEWALGTTGRKVTGKALHLPAGMDFADSDLEDKDFEAFVNGIAVGGIRNNFVVPEGVHRSGDVCMPVGFLLEGSPDGAGLSADNGYVFLGVKKAGDRRAAVFKADIDRFTVKDKNTGKEYAGKLSDTRYYDLETMMPLGSEGRIRLDLGGSVANIRFDFVGYR
ncbi:hypothetical protein BerOc1_02320 [Pseudodesulfovibrio hydrargyri]|uniref:Uncharacterized protein n=1 Tax=Pseudodesulfovibrio hydrargyri TaxID=2125990 RepID=A0A1J5MUU1_9BACT|nr:hypothetical protein [Pseudodesulfovibrio hydrargyri]OIQ50389.1 hypothetical protein BerOc1_02320 [Pseudodesulfovibrio hydrargyri]